MPGGNVGGVLLVGGGGEHAGEGLGGQKLEISIGRMLIFLTFLQTLLGDNVNASRDPHAGVWAHNCCAGLCEARCTRKQQNRGRGDPCFLTRVLGW